MTCGHPHIYTLDSIRAIFPRWQLSISDDHRVYTAELRQGSMIVVRSASDLAALIRKVKAVQDWLER
jgi:hypothetical protein